MLKYILQEVDIQRFLESMKGYGREFLNDLPTDAPILRPKNLSRLFTLFWGRLVERIDQHVRVEEEVSAHSSLHG